MSRLSIPEYVMALAHVAALRSEDPYRKVGAAALDKDNRVIGTAYNGLFPGFTAPEGFWASRDERQKFMMHAEINLCSLFKRGEARIVACTTMPCTSCMQALCAHGVRTIYYGENYAASEAPAIAELYGVELIHVPDYPLAHDFPLVHDHPIGACGGGGKAEDASGEHKAEALRDKIMGCLTGLMCGDALGAPVEFKSAEILRRLFPDAVPGMQQGWGTTAHVAPGDVTDDSEMALCLLDSLCRCKTYNAADALAAYRRWLATDPPSVGLTTASALCGQAQPQSQANGALMRVAPIAAFSLLHPELDWQKAAAQDAALTHVHPRCACANIIFVEALRLAMQGEATENIIAAAVARSRRLGDRELELRLAAARMGEPDYEDHAGWVEIAFQSAFRLLLTTPDAEAVAPALCRLVARGGDTDTNAAIAGALLGARFGLRALPVAWRRAIEAASLSRPEWLRPARGLAQLRELCSALC